MSIAQEASVFKFAEIAMRLWPKSKRQLQDEALESRGKRYRDCSTCIWNLRSE